MELQKYILSFLKDIRFFSRIDIFWISKNLVTHVYKVKIVPKP